VSLSGQTEQELLWQIILGGNDLKTHLPHSDILHILHFIIPFLFLICRVRWLLLYSFIHEVLLHSPSVTELSPFSASSFKTYHSFQVQTTTARKEETEQKLLHNFSLKCQPILALYSKTCARHLAEQVEVYYFLLSKKISLAILLLYRSERENPIIRVH